MHVLKFKNNVDMIRLELYSTNMKTNKISNKDYVIQIASELFLKKGYHVTSMDEVVKVSNVSKSNIYYHFKTKEDLAIGVLRWRISQYEQHFIEIVTNSVETFYEKVERIFNMVFIPSSMEGGCPFISLYLQAGEQSEEIRTLVSHFLYGQIPMIQKMLIEAVETNQIKRKLNPEKTAKLMVSTIEGALMMSAITNDQSYMEDCKESLLFLLY